jgi:GNAT superfamily N-acetyltransferase
VTLAFEFEPVSEADFDALLALRIAVMRASLERIGRFDPQRAAQRFRSTFRAADTRRVRVGTEPAGCVALWTEPDALRIEHFYLDAPFQRRGLGAAVLHRLFAEAPSQATPFRVAALRGSDANRFYERHGFVRVSESEFDIEYERVFRPPPA